MVRLVRRLLGSFILTRPFILLVGTYLLGLIFFAAFRLLFALSFPEHFQTASLGDILRAFAIGVRFDQIVVLVIMLPLILILPWLPLKWNGTRTVVLGWLTIMFSACFLLLLGDIPFYRLSESHLNFMAFDYLADGPTARRLIISDPSFFLSIIVWLSSSLLFWWLTRKLLQRTRQVPHRRSWIGQIILWAIFTAVSLIGIRGRTGLSTMQWGVAYFSQDHFVNQLGLNPIWSFFRAWESEGRDPRLTYVDESARFGFVPFDMALDSTRTMLGHPDETWLSPDSSIARIRKQSSSGFGFQPNVVIVLMESWSGRHTGALESTDSLTPRFDSLAKNGILFTHFYAGGVRTNYGMAASFCAYPAIPGRSVMKRYNALQPFRSLAEILKDRGYHNLFVYGGDKVFDNIAGFFTTHGYDQVLGDEDLGEELVFAKWGIPDHIVFEKAVAKAATLPRPFQTTILTLSNHEPFDLPDSSAQKYFDDSRQSQVLNAFVYADFALGHFIRLFSELPVFDSTIFVFTADHARYEQAELNVDPVNFHIPLLIYSPALLGDSARTVATVGGQVDIILTLMGLLGDDFAHESWGRDLLTLAADDPGFAMMKAYNRMGFITKDFYYMEPLGHPASLFRVADMTDSIVDVSNQFPEELARLQRRMRYYLQVADQLSTPGSLNGPPGL